MTGAAPQPGATSVTRTRPSVTHPRPPAGAIPTPARSALAPLRLLAVALLLLCGAALAHADLAASEPAANTTVREAPEGIALTFSEPVETRFSVFKVYRLEAKVDMAEENAWQRLNGLAGALVSEVLSARDDDAAEARVDTGLLGAEARSADVTIGLREELPAGAYVVMWRVLSIDTHTTQGFLVFEYAPAAE